MVGDLEELVDEARRLPCLSVRQPWADLIVAGIKDVENRRWPTGVRGKLLIHAPKTIDWAAVDALNGWLEAGERHAWLEGRPLGEYRPVTGAILGVSEIVDCVTAHRSRYFHGPYGFVLRDAERFAVPVPCPGQRGIFRVPARLVTGGN